MRLSRLLLSSVCAFAMNHSPASVQVSVNCVSGCIGCIQVIVIAPIVAIVISISIAVQFVFIGIASVVFRFCVVGRSCIFCFLL